MRRAVVVAALLLAGCSSETETQVVQGTALDHGRALFSDPTASPSPVNTFACATCHRADEPPDGRILPGAVLAGSVDRPGFWGGHENDLLRSINYCRTFFMNAQQPWTVDDEEAKVTYLFLTSLPATEPDAVPMTVPAVAADIPAGDAGAGAAVYAQSCQLCHGAVHTGEGRIADRITSIPDEELAFLDSYGFDATQKRVTFIEKVRHGGFLGLYGNMPLYSVEVMSDATLGDLLAYLGLY